MDLWWQNTTVYQIYPRSFQDSNADGVGDLPGIRQRLDYLQWLGVGALWISPIYPSPMADFGYDVSDYTGIHPLFGTMADMEKLLEAVHARNMKLILDFVPNHTSDQHPWFRAARASRDNPYRDWYIWQDPAGDGGPPNNWLSRFDASSAWEWDEKTEQYYLHSFLKEQPDLNWRHPAVRAAMLDVLRFWFDKGVDGFRVDVSYRVMKDPALRDNPPNPEWRKGMDPQKRLLETYSKNHPDVHRFNRWLREVAEEYEGRVLIGEINLPFAQLVKHYGQGDEFHLPFNFSLIHAPDWTAETVRALVDAYEAHLPDGAWPNWVLGNHDVHRIASRVGAAQARVATMLLLTLRGTPTLYYGDEIGMHDVPIPESRVQDPWETYFPGQGLGRDPERTPMQWTPEPNAGFCPPGVEPWLPLARDYQEINVAVEREVTDSPLALTRSLLELRRDSPALRQGSYSPLPAPAGIFAYRRATSEEAYVAVLNFTGEGRVWPLPTGLTIAEATFSTYCDLPDCVQEETVSLRPDEGLLLRPAR